MSGIPQRPTAGLRAELARPLTERQAEVLRFIEAYITEHGWPPSWREIGTGVGIRSTNGVHDKIKALEGKGYIRTRRMQSRCIRVLASAPPLHVEPGADVHGADVPGSTGNE